MYVYIDATYNAYNIMFTDGIKATVIATCKGEQLASRVTDLLNRHGMDDCTLDVMADALEDIEQRTEG